MAQIGPDYCTAWIAIWGIVGLRTQMITKQQSYFGGVLGLYMMLVIIKAAVALSVPKLQYET